MAGSTISTTIAQTVTIGSASYPSPLTITHAGLIEPSSLSTSTLHFENFNETFGGIGVLSTNSVPALDNLGIILGATAASFTDVGQTVGGYGVFFEYGGTVMNAGTIRGGAGRYGKGAVGFTNFGTVINAGLLAGGYGSSEAGSGIETYAGGDVFNGDSGIIKGGSGLDEGGDGIFLAAGTLTNDGTILGGNASLFSGIGVAFGAYTTIINNDLIYGGDGGEHGGGGARLGEEGPYEGGIIINSSLISGGYGSVSGGFGIVVASGSLLNIGVIRGGSGPDAGGYGAAPGNYGQITNDGTILGGTGTLIGGDGIAPAYDLFGPITDATILNNGLIRGGSGSIAGNGVHLYDGSTVTNHGTIIGGYGSSLGNGILINKTSGFITGIGPKATNGVITNGAATDTSALIIGNNGAEIQGTTTNSLINFASIVGRNDGVYIQQTVSTASVIINESTGIINGGTYGVVITGTAGTIVNLGTIRGQLSRSIYLTAGGSVYNIGTASLIVSGNGNGNDAGVRSNGAAYVLNQGTIRSTYTEGVYLNAGGTINNTGRAAAVEGHIDGAAIYNSAGYVTNSGRISGTVKNGIFLGTGTIINEAGGIINGPMSGVDFYLSSGRVTNAGTISGGTDAIKFGGTGTNRLIVDAGAVFIGAVTAASSASNFLELAAETDASIGTVSGIGTQFIGFQNITFDNTASWLIDGNIAGLATGQSITGFAGTDTIILDGFTETGFSYVSGIGLELTGTGDGTTAATIDIAGSFSTGSFAVQNVAAGTEITEVVSGPVIGGAYTSPQAVTDGQGFAAFGNVIIGDASVNGPLTATITMTNAGAATDDDGTLTGAGLSKTATGTYTLTAASPADLQAALRAVVFTPAIIFTATNSELVTGLTLQVSDGVAPAATDRNTVVYTIPGSQPLSLAFKPEPGNPNTFISTTRTGETTYATTPVTQTTDLSATTITAVLNGQQVFQESFNTPYSDPTVQAAVAQADAILARDSAAAGTPVLTYSQVTDGTPQITTVLTGETITGSTVSVTTNFGPGQLFGNLDVNGTPNSTFILAAGQTDINSNVDFQQTIDQTVTTTDTQQTNEDYTITGTPEAATCFAAGTEILTANGPVPVQHLSIGDVLPTLHRGAQRIKWIGQRRYDGRFIAGNHLALPIRIEQGALADGIPSHDLTVSPGHGIFIDDVLIPAWRLINGASITQAARVDEIHYFHIELEMHGIIFAHDCAAESFLDEAGLRNQFHNAPEFLLLYPQGAGSSISCVPRVQAGEVLQRIQNRIAARAGIVLDLQRPAGAVRGCVDAIGPDTIYGWAQDIAAPEAASVVDAWGGGKLLARGLANHYRADLRLAGIGSGCHGFEILLPSGYRGPVTIRHASTTLEHGEFMFPAQQKIAVAVRGFVDAVSPDTVYGWVQDIAAPEAALVVDLWSEGRLLARALANRYRPDLRRAGLGSGCHGFEIPIPPGTSGEVTIRHGATPLAQPELHAPSRSAAA
jgi:hypothetical protein